MCQSPRTGCDDNSNSSLYTPRFGCASSHCLIRFFDPSYAFQIKRKIIFCIFDVARTGHTNRNKNANRSRCELRLHVHIQYKYAKAYQIRGLVDGFIRLHQNRCIFGVKRQMSIVTKLNSTQTFGNQFVIAGRHVPCIDLNQLACVRFDMYFARIPIIVDTFNADTEIAWRWTIVHADRHMIFGIRTNILWCNNREMSTKIGTKNYYKN